MAGSPWPGWSVHRQRVGCLYRIRVGHLGSAALIFGRLRSNGGFTSLSRAPGCSAGGVCWVPLPTHRRPAYHAAVWPCYELPREVCSAATTASTQRWSVRRTSLAARPGDAGGTRRAVRWIGHPLARRCRTRRRPALGLAQLTRRPDAEVRTPHTVPKPSRLNRLSG